MKSAKEILNNIPISGSLPVTKEWVWTEEKCIQAMNEYAAQFMHLKDCYVCKGAGSEFIFGVSNPCTNCSGAGKIIVLPAITTTFTQPPQV